MCVYNVFMYIRNLYTLSRFVCEVSHSKEVSVL